MQDRRREKSEISREAAEWCGVMNSGEAGRDDKTRFAEWVTRSPEHLREFAAVEAIWEEAGRFGAELRCDDRRVVSLFPGNGSVRRHGSARHILGRLAPALAAASLLLAGFLWVGGGLTGKPAGITYETMKGETRVISLIDGSVMHLNTASAARVRFSAGRRLILLERGQAFFTVHKNPDRPFVVVAKNTEVIAVGTAFDVKAFGPELAVTVVEGKVVVREIDETANEDFDDHPYLLDEGPQMVGRWSTDLRANQQIVISSNSKSASEAPSMPRAVAARVETAWRENKLIFDGEPLGRVVADFNRYNYRRILIRDEELRTLRVSGTFDPRDPEAFAQTMATVAGLQIEIGSNGEILLHRKQS